MRKILCTFFIIGMLSSCTVADSTKDSSQNVFSAGNADKENVSDQQTATAETTVVSSRRTLIGVISEVKFDRTPGGGIIRAVAIAPRQGYYDVRLVGPRNLEPDENGILTLEFRVRESPLQTQTSTRRSREIVVGRFISSSKLAAIRSIRVVGVQNQITATP